MRVAVHGFYGAGNVGDEAILSETLAVMRSIEGVRSIVFSRDPRLTRTTHNVSSINPQSAHGLNGMLHLAGSGGYLLGGGGLLKDYGESSMELKAWLRMLRSAHTLRKPTAVWCVGVENLRFSESIRLLRDTLRGVDMISVRDTASKRRLEDIGVENSICVAADPAIRMGHRRQRSRTWSERPRVIVCLRHWFKLGFDIPDAQQNERLLDAVALALDYASMEWGACIEMVPLRAASHDDDRIIHRQVVSRMQTGSRVAVHDEVPTPAAAADVLASASVILAMRLHATILGTSAGVPCVAIAYMSKVRDYMADLEQVRYCIDTEDARPETLISAMSAIAADYEAETRAITAAVDPMLRRLDLAQRLLTELMERPQ